MKTCLTERVQPYMPLLLRCYKCQGYGRETKQCPCKDQISCRCGEICNDEHEPESCNRSQKCYHCKGFRSTSIKTAKYT